MTADRVKEPGSNTYGGGSGGVDYFDRDNELWVRIRALDKVLELPLREYLQLDMFDVFERLTGIRIPKPEEADPPPNKRSGVSRMDRPAINP